MTQEQKKEFDVLREAGLASMPEKERPGGPIWVKAVLKVRTYRGGTSYALATGTDGSGYRIVRTFDADGIASVISVHPYENLNRKYLPEPRNRHELVNYISDAYGVETERVESLAEEELRRLLVASAVRRQIAEDLRESTMEQSRDMEAEHEKEVGTIEMEEEKDDDTEEDTDNGFADGQEQGCGSAESKGKTSGDVAAKPKTRSGKASGYRAGKSKAGRA